MLLDGKDHYAINVLKRGKIESPEDEFLKKVVQKGWKILDIGAHWGGFTLLFAHLVGKEGKVHSVEASPINYHLLVKNVCLNRFEDRVKTYNLAAGDKNGEVELLLAKTSSGHNTVLNSRTDLPVKERIKVPLRRLDDIFPNEVFNLIKIDIEGFEYFALKGLENVIERSSPLWLFIEFSPQFMGNELTQKLESFLTDHFEEVYLAHRKRVFKTDFETAFKISKEKGQRNIFLFKP